MSMVAFADTDRVTESVCHVLSSLGETAREVADELGLKGCKGVRGASEDDPLSGYLRECLGRTELDGLRFLVSDLVITAVYSADWHVNVPLPSAVSRFVQEFDAGFHATLERDDVPAESVTEGRRLLPTSTVDIRR
jgi:hypothetical protein